MKTKSVKIEEWDYEFEVEDIGHIRCYHKTIKDKPFIAYNNMANAHDVIINSHHGQFLTEMDSGIITFQDGELEIIIPFRKILRIVRKREGSKYIEYDLEKAKTAGKLEDCEVKGGLL